MKKAFILLVCVISLESLFSQSPLLKNFTNPSSEARPWTFWYWMRGAVSREGIKADLEAMKQVGLGGTYLMTIKGTEGSEYDHPVNQLTPEWWKLVGYSMRIADSLGLQLGLHVSDGFALAGGPWIKPAESMQKVVFTDTIISGGKLKDLSLKQPESYEGFYSDIAVYALPVSKFLTLKDKFRVIADHPEDSIPFAGGKDFRSDKPCYIQYFFKKPFTLRSLNVIPAGNNFQAQRWSVSASDDGVHFRFVTKTVPPRQGWQNTGFGYTFSIPPTTATYFRLSWMPAGTEPGSEDLDAAKWKPTLKIKSIELSPEYRINGWEGKAGLVWRIADATTKQEIPDKDCTPLAKIIDLTPYFKNGKLNGNLPKGQWRILRMGHTSTGSVNATGGGGKGLECDKFSEKAVQKQFDNWFGAAFSKADSALAHRVLKRMHIDSWECGSQNWSDNFPAEFKKRRGYDLMPYLPLLAGFPIDNVKHSEQVLRDVRITIAELVPDVFFNVMQKNAEAYGCETSAECVAPTMVSDGMLHYKVVDRPMGEFWLRSPTHDKPNDMLDAICGAHIYGKNIIQSESFTELRTNWDEDPAMLKPVLDRNFALGINKVFFHVFVENPFMNKAPGETLDGIGSYFQRDQTWWKQGKAFVDYVTRCQAMLQYGKPVVDVAVFTGEEIPRRALTPDKLVPFLPGIMGKKRVESEQERLANVGQPMAEMPTGVHYAANIFKAEDWINPLNGYAYDSFNKDALLRLAKAENGEMVLPGGAAYKVVIFPDKQTYSEETRRKMAELKRDGVDIPELPLRSGFIFEPDVMAPENVAWTHRTGSEGDVYFISNQEKTDRMLNISFRMKGKTPQLWNPIDGTISAPHDLKVEGNRTQIKIQLPASGSVFVVFAPHPSAISENTDSLVAQAVSFLSKWNVLFLKNNQTIDAEKLFDWSRNGNRRIKYYSGTAVYSNSFNWDGRAKTVVLHLGKVCNLATVRVNGIDCGTAWTAPYQVDITNAIKKGTNTLEIEVTNTWANAINGADKGIPPLEGIWTNAKYRMSGDKLLQSGLLGPVVVMMK